MPTQATLPPSIAVIGLGYVGLPLALCLAKKFQVSGYDSDRTRIKELEQHIDRNEDISPTEFGKGNQLHLLSDAGYLFADVYIVTLPTPVNADNRPDLRAINQACRLLGEKLKQGDLVIFESTVYPGATEEICIPILESVSGLSVNDDFGVGYSPERINPGDRTHRIDNVCKVTSGSSPVWANKVSDLYRQVVHAHIHEAPTIKVAEAAKVVENTQRDVNIALVNELAQLFATLQIDTQDVLSAAATKWNFTPYQPGLVGGHCISIDPYYLCHKANSVGYTPNLMHTSRRLNEGMPAFVANEIIKLLLEHGLSPLSANVLLLGFSFKENVTSVSVCARCARPLTKFYTTG